MTPIKPKVKPKETPERSFVVPLVSAVLVLLVIGIGMIIAGKTQRPDPTLTAAPASGTPGVVIQANSDKMAKEQQIQAKMNAEVQAIKMSTH